MVFIEQEKIPKLFLRYAIPSVFAMVVASIYIIVDGIFIGNKIGAEGLAAINLCIPYISFLVALSVLLTVGGGTITNIFLGKKDKAEASRIFGMTITALLILSVILTIFSVTFIDSIVRFLGGTGNLFAYVKDYLLYSVIFTVFYIIFYILDMGVKGTGSPNYSMKVVVFTASLNIILDYVFIFIFEWEMKGAALASGISHCLGTFILFAYFCFINKDLRIRIVPVELAMIFRMVKNGFSEFINNFSAGITIFMFNIILLRTIGELGVAAYSIVSYATAFIIAVFFGISEGILPIISYNFGAERMERVREILKIAIQTVLAIGVIVSALIFAKPDLLVTLFIKNNPELLAISGYAVRLYAISFLFNGSNIIISAFFTAIEEARKSAIISLLRSLILVVFGLMVLPVLLGTAGIWLVIPFAEVVTLAYSLVLLKKQKTLMRQ